MNYSGKGEIKKRGKDTEDGPNDGSQINSKEMSALLSKDIPPEVIRSHIQKFRSYRRKSSGPSRFNGGSNNNLASLNSNSYYMENNRMVAPVISTNSVNNGSNSGLLEDDLSFVASDDYRNIYDIDAATGDSSAVEAEVAAQVLALSSEIASVDGMIASQTTYIQSLSVSVVQQMKLYTALVDTLLQIDPHKAVELINSPSYLNNRQSGGGGSYSGTTAAAGSYQDGYLRGSNSQTNLMAQQQQQHLHQQPNYGGGQLGGLPRIFPSQDSLANVSSEQIITSMKTAIASPFHSRNSQCSDTDYQQQQQQQQLRSHHQMQQPQSFQHPSGPAVGGILGSQARSEFSAIFEMRAQMDLHRKLFERKEDQLIGHYLYNNQGGANSSSSSGGGGPVGQMQTQQQQQQYGGHSAPPSPRHGAGGGGGLLFAGGPALTQQQLPYVNSMNSFSGESYSYSVQPTAQQIQQQQQAHMMQRLMSNSQQQQQPQHQMIRQYPSLTDMQQVNSNHSDNGNGGGSSSTGSSGNGGSGGVRVFDRNSGTAAPPAFNFSTTNARPPSNSYHNLNNGSSSSSGNNNGVFVPLGDNAVVDTLAADTTTTGNSTWEDGGEFEADLFSFLINNSPERGEVS